jgi:hypothetical protein
VGEAVETIPEILLPEVDAIFKTLFGGQRNGGSLPFQRFAENTFFETDDFYDV